MSNRLKEKMLDKMFDAGYKLGVEHGIIKGYYNAIQALENMYTGTLKALKEENNVEKEVESGREKKAV